VPNWPRRDVVTRAELDNAVDIDEFRTLLGQGSRRRERVSREYAARVASTKGFPDPIVDHQRLRLWHRDDVEVWLDAHRPGWRLP